MTPAAVNLTSDDCNAEGNIHKQWKGDFECGRSESQRSPAAQTNGQFRTMAKGASSSSSSVIATCGNVDFVESSTRVPGWSRPRAAAAAAAAAATTDDRRRPRAAQQPTGESAESPPKTRPRERETACRETAGVGARGAAKRDEFRRQREQMRKFLCDRDNDAADDVAHATDPREQTTRRFWSRRTNERNSYRCGQ